MIRFQSAFLLALALPLTTAVYSPENVRQTAPVACTDSEKLPRDLLADGTGFPVTGPLGVDAFPSAGDPAGMSDFSVGKSRSGGPADADGVSPLENPSGRSKAETLQFTAGGHILGFSTGRVMVASGDHLLSVSFVGAEGARPTVAPEEGGTGRSVPASAGPGSRAGSPPAAPPLTKVSYPDAWPGVTVDYEQTGDGVAKSTYRIAAGAPADSVGRIRLRYNRAVSLDARGNLVIAYPTGNLTEAAPEAWQDTPRGRIRVSVKFRLLSDREAGFETGPYDPALPLTLDPRLEWNTFLGGRTAQTMHFGFAIAVGNNGNYYVTGASTSTWGTPIRPHSGGRDAFVAMFDESGILIWNTFLGGSLNDGGYGINSDGDGNLYVTGYSKTAWGAPIRPYYMYEDAFLAKLNPDGSLLWNTFLGGGGEDYGRAVAVGENGHCFVTGEGGSWGSPILPYSMNGDAFVAELDENGNLLWNTFLGGLNIDQGRGITLDADGNIFVTGSSESSWGLPLRPFSGDDVSDAFVAKLNPNGALLWNTFLGSTGSDFGNDIVTDSNGNCFVVGDSNASWGSEVPPLSYYGPFVAKLDGDGSLLWNTFPARHTFAESANTVALDSQGNIYLGGESSGSWGTPVRPYSGANDAHIIKVDGDGNMVWNTFLGGSSYDQAYGIATNGNGDVIVIGDSSASWGTPIHPFSGSHDAFIAKVNGNGSVVWNSFMGARTGPTSHRCESIAVDGNGNAYVTGYSDSTWGDPIEPYSAHAYNPLIAKIDRNGNLLWNTFLWSENGWGIAVDSNGNSYVTGEIENRDFLFVTKLDGDGNRLWTRNFGSYTYANIGYSIVVDGEGNIFVTGLSNHTWGSPVRPFSGYSNAVVVKLDHNGNLIWNTFLGGDQYNSYNSGYGIAIDNIGNSYITGDSYTTWGEPVRPFSGGYDAFVAKLDGSGHLLWNTFLGGTSSDIGYGISVDATGNIFVTGNSNRTWGSPILPFQRISAFVAKLNPNGTLLWNTFLGKNNSRTEGYGIAVDNDGSCFVTGFSDKSWGFPVRPWAGEHDGFLARLDANGNLLWNTFIGGTKDDESHAIALDANGNCYLAGFSMGTWSSPVRVFSGSQDGFATMISHYWDSAISISIAPVTICSGQPETMTASVIGAAGTPTGTVDFYDDTSWVGVRSLSEGTASLSYPATYPGTHSLTAHYNGDFIYVGSWSSASNLVVNEAPVVTILGPHSICISGSATLDAGAGYLSYLWFPGGETTRTITVSPSVETEYSVTVSNSFGCSGTSAAHAVRVVSPPVMVAQPESGAVLYGQSVRLAVRCVGTEPLHYQWYRGSTGNTAYPVGTNSNTYETGPVTSTTYYWIRVTNECGTVDSGTAILTVRFSRNDLNADGVVDAQDILLEADLLAANILRLPCGIPCADVNEDQKIDVLDLLAVVNAAIGGSAGSFPRQ